VRDDARAQIADGKDPSQQKKLDKIVAATAANNTFGAIAEEHLAALKENGAAEAKLTKVRWLLLDLASPLTKRPIAEITPAEILIILKRYEKSGRRETARRLRGVIGKVFRFAVAIPPCARCSPPPIQNWTSERRWMPAIRTQSRRRSRKRALLIGPIFSKGNLSAFGTAA
jgi:integrase